MKNLILAFMATAVSLTLSAERNPAPVSALLDRVGGPGTSQRFITEVASELAENGQETFVIGQREGKPYIGGSALSAVTTGIGKYLSRHAHVMIAWDRLTEPLAQAELPLPCCDEVCTTSAPLRYYLNY